MKFLHILPVRRTDNKPSCFLAFIKKESKHILRDRRTMLILFGMPVVMMLLFGFAIRTDVKDVRTLVVTTSMDQQTQKVIECLNQSEYFIIVGNVATPAEAERMIRSQQADVAIVFTGNFADNLNKEAGIQLITDASDPNMAQQYANYAQNCIMAGLSENRSSSNITSSMTSSVDANPVCLKMLYNPRMLSAYNFVPGIMGMLLLLICAMMTSISIVKEKEKGTMEVLLVSPVKPIMVIISKAIPYLLLALLILVAILLMSYYVLKVPLSGSIFWIFMVSMLYILLALSLGLLISNIAQTQLVALLFSAVVLLMPTLMLSGLMFPIESMPKILQYFSCIVPARWYISAMRKLMIMGVGVENIISEITILSAMTVLLLSVSLVKFKTRL